jgi:hypothetical protein
VAGTCQNAAICFSKTMSLMFAAISRGNNVPTRIFMYDDIVFIQEIHAESQAVVSNGEEKFFCLGGSAQTPIILRQQSVGGYKSP